MQPSSDAWRIPAGAKVRLLGEKGEELLRFGTIIYTPGQTLMFPYATEHVICTGISFQSDKWQGTVGFAHPRHMMAGDVVSLEDEQARAARLLREEDARKLARLQEEKEDDWWEESKRLRPDLFPPGQRMLPPDGWIWKDGTPCRVLVDPALAENTDRVLKAWFPAWKKRVLELLGVKDA